MDLLVVQTPDRWYKLCRYLPGTLEVFLNGVRQRRDVFFFESGSRGFITTEAPHDDDALSVQYEVAGPGEVIVFPTIGASGIDPTER